MATNYDRLYQLTPDALGAPTQVFVDFFDGLAEVGLRVLDIGCGQGRDALFIARKGHSVVGVDLSAHGIQGLLAAAAREDLPIQGIVADVTTFTPKGSFDVLLIDRTLHMLPEKPRLETLARLIGHVADQGWVAIADERSNIATFKQVFADHDANWQTVIEARGNLFLRRLSE